ncbi:MAG TPA: dipeptide ABC transporter ATP-binding protein [Anaerolineales bacterium]|nr:dipeptide ABC transporter ATP-binding protein [Anaerolineales bacterium]
MSTPLLELRNVVKHFPVKGGLLQRTIANVKAVQDVSLTIQKGETLGLVGESGCGKSTLGRVILNLIPPTSGQILFEGKDITTMTAPQMVNLRRQMQVIFQDPYSSLDPRVPVGDSIAEGLKVHGIGSSAEERRQKVTDILQRVGMQAYHADRFPHEFSGGQRQRIGIARALVLKPKFIVCDEPVSALDVSVQAQVLNLLKELQKDFGLTYLFIAHDMGVVEHISDRVAVMYLGKVVEVADRRAIYANPTHPYTQALMSAIPVPDPELRRERVILQGDVPSPLRPPSGCAFHPRCPVAQPVCSQETPQLLQLSDTSTHAAACLLRNGQVQAEPTP